MSENFEILPLIRVKSLPKTNCSFDPRIDTWIVLPVQIIDKTFEIVFFSGLLTVSHSCLLFPSKVIMKLEMGNYTLEMKYNFVWTKLSRKIL